MSTASIMKALFTRLEAFVASPPLPIKTANDTSSPPPADHRYLRTQFVPNVANRVLIDSDGPHQMLGLLQVSVYWTKGQGEGDPRRIADAIAAHFPCDLKLRQDGLTVRITKRPDVADVLVEKEAIQIPVMIAWECWA